MKDWMKDILFVIICILMLTWACRAKAENTLVCKADETVQPEGNVLWVVHTQVPGKDPELAYMSPDGGKAVDFCKKWIKDKTKPKKKKVRTKHRK